MVNVESNAAAHFSDDDHDYCNTYRCPIISRAESQRTQAGYSSEGTKHVAGRERKQETFSTETFTTQQAMHTYKRYIKHVGDRNHKKKQVSSQVRMLSKSLGPSWVGSGETFEISRVGSGSDQEVCRKVTNRADPRAVIRPMKSPGKKQPCLNSFRKNRMHTSELIK